MVVDICDPDSKLAANAFHDLSLIQPKTSWTSNVKKDDRTYKVNRYILHIVSRVRCRKISSIFGRDLSPISATKWALFLYVYMYYVCIIIGAWVNNSKVK